MADTSRPVFTSSDLSRRDFLLQTSLAATALAGLAVADALPAAPIPRSAHAGAQAGSLHQILRIHLPGDAPDKRAGEVIDYCRRTGCREVLLFTTSYDQAPSFQSLEAIDAYVTKIEPQAKRLADAGIIVSVNVLQKLGHV